ncbi:MAG: HEAT repeat domain-containing protein, partial [Planctomycetaceae bacterium]|nr:HEAT repeat domain-containing protein [Planctomycetaceae bacterium]
MPFVLFFLGLTFVNANANPFDNEMRAKIAVLQNGGQSERARAAEALGYMRAYKAENALIAALSDDVAEVRRSAALSLAWCGSRVALKPLLQKLDDTDWTVRQSAGTALENLTGMAFLFDALSNPAVRKQAVTQWENWINALPDKKIPDDVLQLLRSSDHCKAARGLRAAGALGLNAATVKLLTETLETWKKNSNEEDSDAKIRVQTALRALGRSDVSEAFPVLCDFLRNPQWTRYAADALGDFGGDDAAAVLMGVFPQHARQLTDENLSGERISKAAAT